MRRTFISYAHNEPDRKAARRLYRDLHKAGHAPWLDEEDLLPGENWANRIRQEIRECKQFIALVSNHSLNKRGFVQNEIRIALEVLDTIPVNDRFLIPVRLDLCCPKDERLSRLQWADLFSDYDAGLHRLLRSLDERKRTPGRLWINVGVEIPADVATWSDDRLFRYIREVLEPEARERAQRDYEYVPVGDSEKAIRVRTEEKLVEVATRFGFLDSLKRLLKREHQDNEGV